MCAFFLLNFFYQIERHHDYVQEAIAFVPCKHFVFTCQLLSFAEIPSCVGRLLVKHQQLLYKITLFINTGVIQAQGHCLQTLTLLTLLVNSIYKSKDDIDKNSETELKSLRISNSETSQKIETSNTSSNDSANVKRSLEKTCDSYTSPKYAAEDTNSSLQYPKDLNFFFKNTRCPFCYEQILNRSSAKPPYILLFRTAKRLSVI